MDIKTFLFSLLFCTCAVAQHDSIVLKEVVVGDYQLQRYSGSQSVVLLTDSVARHNRASLVDLLENHTSVSLRQNGFGMVSSASFRGTTAQQTAVIWNGININSQFNGQTDFSAIGSSDYETVSVRSGGGSTIYGSSAIGGSIHLQNEVSFGGGFNGNFLTRYGSFGTTENYLKLQSSADDLAVQVAASYNASENDFPYVGGGRNINGRYRNSGINVVSGYRFNPRNVLKFYSRMYEDKRNFPLIHPAEIPTRYTNFNAAQLLEWTSVGTKFSSKTRVAHLREHYRYFASPEDDNPDSGTASSIIAKQDLDYKVGERVSLNALFEHTSTWGTGTDIRTERRDISAFALLTKHRVSRRFSYEVGARKELTSAYESPLLFSGGAAFHINNQWKVRGNISKNFRIPTFNDLYWAEGGSGDLEPETSVQGELGAEFTSRFFRVSATAYAIKISDMIQWLPGSTTIWQPQNVRSVLSSGIEARASGMFEVLNSEFSYLFSYAYTRSENEDTGKQLIYVPHHKMAGSAGWRYRKISLVAQFLFNGGSYVRSDNNPRYMIDAFATVGFMAEYKILKNLAAGFQAANIFNEDYETVAGRPMPGRNFNAFVNLKF